jgi:hypothetical protein
MFQRGSVVIVNMISSKIEINKLSSDNRRRLEIQFTLPNNSWRSIIFEKLILSVGQENRINGRGIRCADHATPSIRKSWH